jgi:hypothetical protein
LFDSYHDDSSYVTSDTEDVMPSYMTLPLTLDWKRRLILTRMRTNQLPGLKKPWKDRI